MFKAKQFVEIVNFNISTFQKLFTWGHKQNKCKMVLGADLRKIHKLESFTQNLC